MIAIDRNNNKSILKDTVAYLQNLGFKNIKADVDGYETPKSYHKKNSEVTLTPDIVAEHDNKKHYFEVSLKSEKPSLLKSKWMFLDTLTSIKGHYFRIITHKGHYKFTEELLKEINLDKKPIKL